MASITRSAEVRRHVFVVALCFYWSRTWWFGGWFRRSVSTLCSCVRCTSSSRATAIDRNAFDGFLPISWARLARSWSKWDRHLRRAEILAGFVESTGRCGVRHGGLSGYLQTGRLRQYVLVIGWASSELGRRGASSLRLDLGEWPGAGCK